MEGGCQKEPWGGVRYEHNTEYEILKEFMEICMFGKSVFPMKQKSGEVYCMRLFPKRRHYTHIHTHTPTITTLRKLRQKNGKCDHLGWKAKAHLKKENM